MVDQNNLLDNSDLNLSLNNMKNSLLSEDFLKGDYIILNDMGFPSNLIKKVYAFLKPNSLEQAIQFMSTENGIYQHDFYMNYTNPKYKNKCYICGDITKNHINYDNNIDNMSTDINENEFKNENLDDIKNECFICGELVSSLDLIEYKKCNHQFCNHC